jgi:hypothetical protein
LKWQSESHKLLQDRGHFAVGSFACRCLRHDGIDTFRKFGHAFRILLNTTQARDWKRVVGAPVAATEQHKSLNSQSKYATQPLQLGSVTVSLPVPGSAVTPLERVTLDISEQQQAQKFRTKLLSCLVCLPRASEQKRREAKIQIKRSEHSCSSAYSLNSVGNGRTALLCRSTTALYRSDNLCVAPDTTGQENCPSNKQLKSSLPHASIKHQTNRTKSNTPHAGLTRHNF